MAVLGGGAAGLAAAHALSRTPELRDAFDITVYQHGWRLGGKGASGRDGDRHERIEEHGLHIWFGFYRNAFALLEESYRELAAEGRQARFAGCAEAFEPCEQLALADPSADGWEVRSFSLPAAAALRTEHPLLWFPPYLLRLIDGVAVQLLGIGPGSSPSPPVARARAALLDAVAEAERLAAVADEPDASRDADAAIDGLIEVARRTRRAERELEGAALAGRRLDGATRFVARLLDFATAVIAILALRILPRLGDDPAPFDHLNAVELRDLLRGRRADGAALDCPDGLRRDLGRLRSWGLLASDGTLDASFVRVLYDLAFAYRDGDPGRPDVAAGVALENLLNTGFGHGGGLMHKMRAGMGDIVFAPIYRLLGEAVGDGAPRVRFEFFSAVERVEAPDGRVERVTVRRQARLANPGRGYRPLRDVGGLPCWPSAPLAEQLDASSRKALAELRRRSGDRPELAFEREADPLGATMETQSRSLLAGRDFDDVVLAIPVGALPEIAGRAGAGVADDAFQAMVGAAPTVATNALQVWLADDYEALGRPPALQPARAAILGGYRKPFDTYCDMTHLLDEEAWPAEAPPDHLAYFCGPMHDPPRDWRAADREAGRRALRFLREHADAGAARPFWQRAFGPEQLVAAPGRSGWDRFEDQYWRANSTGWERYAASHAGTLAQRLRPDGRRPGGEPGMHVDNLVLAGDWTSTAVNAGSVEAAVSSGLAAAQALIESANRRDGGTLPAPAVALPPWRRAPTSTASPGCARRRSRARAPHASSRARSCRGS